MVKSGMYGETESVVIGDMTISRMSNTDGDMRIWITDNSPDGGDGGEFSGIELGKIIKEFYDKNF